MSGCNFCWRVHDTVSRALRCKLQLTVQQSHKMTQEDGRWNVSLGEARRSLKQELHPGVQQHICGLGCPQALLLL